MQGEDDRGSDWGDQGRSPTSPTRVLIVEDDDDFVGDVETTASYLEGQSIQWSRARGVAEALDLISAEQAALPDVAVVDVGLSDGNGLDFVRSVRERNFVFPIVVISQSELGEVRYGGAPISKPQLMQLGANEFQSKTQISESQREFLRLVISMATGFERLFNLVDEPDRKFHAAISRQALSDLKAAIGLCNSRRLKKETKEPEESPILKTVVFLIEGVASRERIRLDYTLKLSIGDRIRAFSARAEIKAEGRSTVDIIETRFEKIVSGLVKAVGQLLRLNTGRSR